MMARSCLPLDDGVIAARLEALPGGLVAAAAVPRLLRLVSVGLALLLQGSDTTQSFNKTF